MQRRDFFKLTAVSILGMAFPLRDISLAGKSAIEHPIKNPPEYTDREKCDSCGMNRNNWARTRHSFSASKGRFYTCSIHCLAVMTMKLKEEARQVKVAEYFRPENMIDAGKAVYVIGSSASGTMTTSSKIAFASGEEAEKFIAENGGRPADFKEALSEAKKETAHNHMKMKSH